MSWAPGQGDKFRANPPFPFALARGNVPGATGIHVHGYNGAVGTAMETLWAESALKGYISSAAAMTISSDAAADDLTSTGAEKVDIVYLDDDWAVQTLADVEMNGQSGVATASILRVLDIIVRQTGSGNRNAGTIYMGTGTVTTGKPAVVHAAMPPNFNRLFGGAYSIPAGYRGVVTRVGGSVGEGKTANIFLATRDFGEDTFHPHHHELSFQTGFSEPIFHLFEEKTDIELQAFNDVASQAVSGSFDLVLIEH